MCVSMNSASNIQGIFIGKLTVSLRDLFSHKSRLNSYVESVYYLYSNPHPKEHNRYLFKDHYDENDYEVFISQ